MKYEQQKAIFASIARKARTAKTKGIEYLGAVPSGKTIKSTGMTPKFQKFSKRIYMKPTEFLALTRAGEGMSNTGKFENEVENMERLRGRIRQGKFVNEPILDINVKTGKILEHDGRHRALASLIEGANKIPVDVIANRYYSKTGIIRRIPITRLTKNEKMNLINSKNFKMQKDWK